MRQPKGWPTRVRVPDHRRHGKGATGVPSTAGLSLGPVLGHAQALLRGVVRVTTKNGQPTNRVTSCTARRAAADQPRAAAAPAVDAAASRNTVYAVTSPAFANCCRSPAPRVQCAVTPAGLGRSCQGGATEVAPPTLVLPFAAVATDTCWRCLGCWPSHGDGRPAPGRSTPRRRAPLLGGPQGVLHTAGRRAAPAGGAKRETARASHTVTYRRWEQERISSS
jgi:hypothetical protein